MLSAVLLVAGLVRSGVDLRPTSVAIGGRNVTCVPNQHLADGRWRCLCARVLNI